MIEGVRWVLRRSDRIYELSSDGCGDGDREGEDNVMMLAGSGRLCLSEGLDEVVFLRLVLLADDFDVDFRLDDAGRGVECPESRCSASTGKHR